MSAAFRLLILMLCAFAAAWVYRYRSTEISSWLNPVSPLKAEGRQSLVSPVEKVLEPELNTAWIRLRGNSFPRGAAGAVPEDYRGEETEGVKLSEEEVLMAADLPLQEDPAGTEGESGLDEGSGADGQPIAEEDMAASEPQPVVSGEGDSGVEPLVFHEERELPEVPRLPEDIVAYEEITYKVQEGESLWKIAQKVLGSGIRYREIYELNKAALKGNDSKLPPGTELKIRKSAREERLKNPAEAVDTSVEGKSARGTAARARSPKEPSNGSPKKSVRRK